MRRINEQYAVEVGPNSEGQIYTSLYKTHGRWPNGDLFEYDRKHYVKAWSFTPDCNDTEVSDEEIQHEIMLNDYTRWNNDLKPGDKYEISEATYYDQLGSVPPHYHCGSYFEVGEPHHDDENGNTIYRACWMEDGKYYTGYPKRIKQQAI